MRGYEDISSIWAYADDTRTVRKDIRPLLDIGVSLCPTYRESQPASPTRAGH